MAQEFTIKSQDIEDKINQLLPSQGGQGAGIDFSASTMVIPIVDLTETAEGSALRQDLQSSLSLNSVTTFDIQSGSSTIISTTGYYRIYGVANLFGGNSPNDFVKIEITDGFTTKQLWGIDAQTNADSAPFYLEFDFLALVKAGESVSATAQSSSITNMKGITRQIADLSGNLVNP